MTTPKEVLLKTLEYLGREEFETFKWYLYHEVLEGFKSIPKSRLEEASRTNTVEQMVNTYTAIDALKVTIVVLEKMDKHELVEKIPETFREPRAAQPKMEEWSTTLVHSTDAFWKKNVNNPDIYPVDRKTIKSRVALLITNIQFANVQLKKRYGAERDEKNMEKLLSSLGYEVVKRRNLTAEEINEALIEFSRHPKLKDTDSVLVVIMSHGKLGAVFGVNSEDETTDVFDIDNIYRHLGSEECPALLNKPKIIIIQACRGVQGGDVLVSDNADQAMEWDCVPHPGAQGNMKRRVHREKDFTSLLSSTPGTLSYRHTRDGSVLIQYIVEVFNTFAHQDHIEELFRRVMRRCEDFAAEDIRQMPTKDRCSLTKLFYFFPGY